MTTWTDFAENKLIDFFFRAQALPALPASWYLGLLTADTDDDGAPLTEVTGGSYARVAVARSLANFAGTQGAGTVLASTGASGLTSNNVDFIYPAPTGNWGTVTMVGLFDAAAAGNLWLYGPLALPKSVASGDAAPKFPAAAFSFLWDN